jgi:cyclophilin family peptidyl-prolyl cis-trans isomerase
MPHAVYTFLSAVNDGLWNDSVFLHRTSHIVQSAPIDSNGNDKRDLFQFENHLAFPEYSSEYGEHAKYTLGFSGRPGGPEFYINTSDNGKYHGPGGQNHHALSEEADPCFAKVIRGFDVIEKMEALNMKATSVEAGVEALFSVIKSVKIIRPKSSTEVKVTNQKAPQSQ